MLSQLRILIVVASALILACSSDSGGGVVPPGGTPPANTDSQGTSPPNNNLQTDASGGGGADASGGTQTPPTNEMDTSGSTPTPGTPDPGNAAGPGCTPVGEMTSGFAPQIERAELTFVGSTQVMRYHARTAEGFPHDALLIESFIGDPYYGPSGPGTFSLQDANVVTGGLRLVAYKDCGEQGCEKMFLPDSGSIEVKSFGGFGDNFAASLAGMRFREVVIDSEAGAITFVEGGLSWCLDGHAFTLEVQVPEVNRTCVGVGTGRMMGDNIANFSMLNCGTGLMVESHSLCGRPKVVWVVATAGWCPACGDWLPRVNAFAKPYGEDIRLMFVMGEDGYYKEPSLAYCQQYARSKGMDPADFYIDWGDNYGSFETLFTNIYPYSSAGIGLPWNALLRGSNLEYIYNDNGGGDILQVLESLLME
jgi:hypothetical protein